MDASQTDKTSDPCETKGFKQLHTAKCGSVCQNEPRERTMCVAVDLVLAQQFRIYAPSSYPNSVPISLQA